MDKSALRKELIKKREKISAERKIILDKEITEKLLSLDEYKRAKNILLFASTPFEFNTNKIAEASLGDFKNVFYPKCLDKNGNMKFFKIQNKNDFREGLYGIWEPYDSLPEFKNSSDSVCIVPALSVDNFFYRIGYGKGYYDRFLHSFNGKSICPCYDFLLCDKLPVNEFDEKIHILVTEKTIRRSHCG